MALEDIEGPGKIIKDLDRANPAATDDRSEGDNHIRGIKNTQLNQFPALVGPILVNDSEINQLSGVNLGPTVQQQFDALEADVQANTGNISVNAGNIVTNASGVSGNAGDISALDGRVAALEALPSAATPAAKMTAFTNISTFSNVPTGSDDLWQKLTGSDLIIPADWGGGSAMINASVNLLIYINAGFSDLTGIDLGLVKNDAGVVGAVRFDSILGIQPGSTPTQALYLGTQVNLSAMMSVVPGDTISIWGRKSVSTGTALAWVGYANFSGHLSTLTAFPVTAAA